MGRQLLLSYKHAGVIFDKRMIVLPRFEGTVVHVWSYTAPRAQYSSLHPKAERILRSWTILPKARKEIWRNGMSFNKISVFAP